MADLPGLIVLADGVQAAFVAGAVAELERSGVHWQEGAGAGLGAQVAALALLGEAGEAERRWLRQADLGCPLLRSRLENGLRRHPSATGLLILPDLFTMCGWLDPEELEEYLVPEAAGLPARLTARGARLWVAVEDFRAAAREWVEISTGEALAAALTLRAAASFTGGWPPVEDEQPGGAVLSGGVGALPARLPEWTAAGASFAVCGFPVPAVARTAAPANLLEILQRRDETAAAEVWRSAPGGNAGLCVIAPTSARYRAWAGKVEAELGVEYPLPWERNGELARGLVDFGRFSAREALAGIRARS